jgi:NAD(P)-dependent dehydrogenase (short-subunit alcohol dehydrogenase family)
MAVVLVTGGSSGIGLATVRRLAAAGDQVFCASRSAPGARLPEGVTPVAVDVADAAACEAAVQFVVAGAGRLEVNVFGPMRLARAALPVMRGQGGGRIVNVTSVNDVAPEPFGGWYSASKAALASASAVLGAEVHGFGIFVTVVAPGLFRTAMSDQLFSFQVASDSAYAGPFEALREQSRNLMDEAGDPDEVASAIEVCIRASEPAARIVVGADAIEMDTTARRSSAEDIARLLRDFVTSLTH